jgi:hypothetical protein
LLLERHGKFGENHHTDAPIKSMIWHNLADNLGDNEVRLSLVVADSRVQLCVQHMAIILFIF